MTRAQDNALVSLDARLRGRDIECVVPAQAGVQGRGYVRMENRPEEKTATHASGLNEVKAASRDAESNRSL